MLGLQHVQMAKKIFTWVGLLLVAYLGLGLVIHHWVAPVETPDYATYFVPGSVFESKLEGLSQKVVKLENGMVETEVTLQPKTKGPLPHAHELFAESFVVERGVQSMQYGSEIMRLRAGESVVIPIGETHRPFNETDSVVVLRATMPADFAYCLSQVYPAWDEDPKNSVPPNVLFQLAVFGDHFDSYPTENAPPKPVLKAFKFLLAPTARLLVYTNYEEKYR